MLYLGLAFLLLGLALCFIAGRRIYLNSEVKEENKKIENENLDLKVENSSLQFDNIVLKNENSILKSQKEDLILEQKTAASNYAEVLEVAYQKNEENYDLKIAKLKEDYKKTREEIYNGFENYCILLEKSYNDQEQKYDEQILNIEKEFKENVKKLENIKETLAAATDAQLRAREMESKIGFYSLHLTDAEKNTIVLIEELKPRLPEPRVLSMLVWSTFFQKQTTALCNNVLGPSVVCGIYKITNQKTGLCYIGQAVDIATRWKSHVKCGLGIDTPAQNKLYQAMKKDGVINFTFELLEKCDKAQLNEKEKFYIDLYQSYEFGYNSTKGNK